MLRSYLTGITGLVAVALAWAGVQLAWRRAFPGGTNDPDALAGRTGCRDCEASESCPRSAATPPEEGP